MLSKTTIAAAAAALIGYAAARPEFQMRIPNGGAGSEPGSGITCSALGHDRCVGGASRNAFGEALKAAGLQWTKELCEADSDGDGVTNGLVLRPDVPSHRRAAAALFPRPPG
jgi:hypothetical protein